MGGRAVGRVPADYRARGCVGKVVEGPAAIFAVEEGSTGVRRPGRHDPCEILRKKEASKQARRWLACGGGASRTS